LTVPQLLTTKQIATLRSFDPRVGGWTADLLSSFCRPPHRLQQLQEVEMGETTLDAAVMVELVHLPSLTSLSLYWFTSGAFAFLPHFPRLQRLGVSLGRDDGSDPQSVDIALLASALSACTYLTDLRLMSGECSESTGSQLLQAVPRLRTLAFEFCSLPSLRFLLHTPNLKELSLFECTDVRPGHMVGIGAFAPQLEWLSVQECAGLRLDEAEQQLLTPPGALGLPHLREFEYWECT
jgi:hypothetical protein